jgi:hypothetical protein
MKMSGFVLDSTVSKEIEGRKKNRELKEGERGFDAKLAARKK